MYGGYASISISERIPTFACPYSSGSAGNCYILAMQHQLHISWGDLFSFRGLAFVTGLGTFILFFIIFNKAWCGYICPLGTIQDWITKLRKLTGISFARYNKKSFKRIKIIKYIFLALVIIIPLGLSNSFFGLPKFSHDLAAPFCQVCPGRTTLPLFALDSSQLFIDFTSRTAMIMSTLGMIFMGIFFVGAFVKKRFFCFLCPMSALQFLFSKIGLLRLTKVGDKCTKCGNCSRVCDIGIVEIAEDIKSKNIVKDDCMMCFKCVEACPENDCLKVSFIGIPIFNSTDEGFFKRYSCNKDFSIIDLNDKEIKVKDKNVKLKLS
jgi:polyferredoxin